MHVFQSENDHAGCGGGGHADNLDLSHGSPRQIAHVNHRTISLGEHGGIHRWRFRLCVFRDCGFEGKRVHRVVEIGCIGAHGAEKVAHMYALVCADVDIHRTSSAQLRVEVSA